MFVTNILQSLWVCNSRIPSIRNAKFLGYYFYIITNVQGDFQICISVPLIQNVIFCAVIVILNLFRKFCETSEN